MCVPTPGTGRAQLKFMAEQVMRFRGIQERSSREMVNPSMRMLEALRCNKPGLGCASKRTWISVVQETQGNGRRAWHGKNFGLLHEGRKPDADKAIKPSVKRANGSDKFEAGPWLGKTDRADFRMVATSSVLKSTRTSKRLPTPFDPEAATL